jgi:hypothetical protein
MLNRTELTYPFESITTIAPSPPSPAVRDVARRKELPCRTLARRGTSMQLEKEAPKARGRIASAKKPLVSARPFEADRLPKMRRSRSDASSCRIRENVASGESSQPRRMQLANDCSATSAYSRMATRSNSTRHVSGGQQETARPTELFSDDETDVRSKSAVLAQNSSGLSCAGCTATSISARRTSRVIWTQDLLEVFGYPMEF